MPHAWVGGRPTKLLKARIDAVPDGGTIVMIAPPNPYRCPPGPYERVSMMAHVLKAKGRQQGEDRHHRSQGDLLQAGRVSGRLGEALSRHGRVARPEDPRPGSSRSIPRPTPSRTGFETYRTRRWSMSSGPVRRQDCPRRAAREPERLLPDPAGQHEIRCRSQHLRAWRRLYRRRYAKSGFSANSQAKVAAMTIAANCWRHAPSGALYQHLLEPDRDRRRHQGRRRLRGQGRGDQGVFHLCLAGQGRRRSAQAKYPGKHRLVPRHHNRCIRLTAAQKTLHERAAAVRLHRPGVQRPGFTAIVPPG